MPNTFDAGSSGCCRTDWLTGLVDISSKCRTGRPREGKVPVILPGNRYDQCEQILSLWHIVFVKDHGCHPVNQTRLLACFLTSVRQHQVDFKISTVGKTNKHRTCWGKITNEKGMFLCRNEWISSNGQNLVLLNNGKNNVKNNNWWNERKLGSVNFYQWQWNVTKKEK